MEIRYCFLQQESCRSHVRTPAVVRSSNRSVPPYGRHLAGQKGFGRPLPNITHRTSNIKEKGNAHDDGAFMR